MMHHWNTHLAMAQTATIQGTFEEFIVNAKNPTGRHANVANVESQQ
jgi:hypothetical protein